LPVAYNCAAVPTSISCSNFPIVNECPAVPTSISCNNLPSLTGGSYTGCLLYENELITGVTGVNGYEAKSGDLKLNNGSNNNKASIIVTCKKIGE